MAPHHFPYCRKCGEIPLAEHRQVFARMNGETMTVCNDHVEVQTLGESRPRYLPAVPVQSGRWYVPYDPDLAAIGVIEPVFVEEERVELYIEPGSLRAEYLDVEALTYAHSVPTGTRIVTVPVLRWQKVAEKTETRAPVVSVSRGEPFDWWGATMVFLTLALILFVLAAAIL